MVRGAFEVDPEDKASQEGKGKVLTDALFSAAHVGVLAIGYTAISTGLITFNKYLIHDGRFPFVIFIGMLHMSFSLLCNLALYRLCPYLYPSLTDPERKVDIDRSLVLKVLLPIAVCFSAQLVLSNMAFMHSSLAFLQMMKQSNVVLVYLFSLALGLECFSCQRASVLLCIVAATGMTINGELNFSLRGFLIQAVSMLCESLKLTLQSYSLSAAGRRLDALTYVLLMAPLVLFLLLLLLLLLALLWPACPEVLTLPCWSTLVEYRMLLVANGCLAFAMNVAHALFIKQSSATTFILTGVVMKDVVIVTVGALFLGELLSPMQVAGFTAQLIAIMVWSVLKAAPKLSIDSPKLERPFESKAVDAAHEKEGVVFRSLWVEAGEALVHSHAGSPRSMGGGSSTGLPPNDEDMSQFTLKTAQTTADWQSDSGSQRGHEWL